MKRLIWLTSVLILWACESTPPTTELLVVVDSDLEPGSTLSALHVEVFDRAGDKQLTTHDFKLDASSTLPMSFSLYPLGDASSLRLVVTGRGPRSGATVDLVERQVIASFVHEQRRLLPVLLQASCRGALCRDADGDRTDQTCLAGACVPTAEAPLSPVGDGPLGGYELDGGSQTPDKRDAGGPCTIDDDCKAALGRVTPVGCAIARCVDDACAFEVVDADGDGDRARLCSATGVTLTPGMDCDDGNRAISTRAWDGPAGDGHPDGCDGVDNDCDGKPDDGRVGSQSCTCDPAKDIDVACSQREDGTDITWPAGAPAGACRAGKRSCVDGAWTPCKGAVAPLASDNCSAANDDSNCNGVIGEGCQCTDGATRPCGVNLGACKAGTQTCTGGRWATECTGALSPATADTCDPGNDANCNGTPNDGCKCVNGSASTCGQVLPALGDCVNRAVVCAGGQWPTATCMAQCDDCPMGSPCAPGTCVDGQHTFTCDCPTGYDGDGMQACKPQVTICPVAGGGMDGGAGVRCGPHTMCRTSADGGVGCACQLGYVLSPGSDPPTCVSILGG